MLLSDYFTSATGHKAEVGCYIEKKDLEPSSSNIIRYIFIDKFKIFNMKSWRDGSLGKVLALETQGPEFHPPELTKTNIGREKRQMDPGLTGE